MNNLLKDNVRELLEMFSTFSSIVLVQVALGQNQNKTKSGVTVSDLLVKVRKT